MQQIIDYQQFIPMSTHHNGQNPKQVTIPRLRYQPERKDLPKLLSKKWLCIEFGFYGSRKYQQLYKKVLTKEVLLLAKIDKEQYRRKSEFNRTDTLALIEVLGL